MNAAKNNSGAPKEIRSENKKQPTERGAAPFPIAGLGASAGGLTAIESLLENLPSSTGISYVIVQHLSPDHKSILPEILQRKTRMPVHSVTEGMNVEADHVYVIPPDTYLNIVDGHLTLIPRKSQKGIFLPIDFFFKHLAHIYQNKAIGILLSGTGSDGTEGFRDIKAEGGITFAQDNSADFTGMPANAIYAGFVDFVLPVDKIANELNNLLKLPYTTLSPDELQQSNESELRRILMILHNKKGVDFSLYKQTTINRRILRRMSLNHKRNLEDYTAMLRENNNEGEQLYQDLLINVTTFFRDPAVFNVLTNKILPEICKNRKGSEPIRVWIPACASGEEACSFAICIFEYLSKNGLNIPFNIFATDLNPAAIEKARSGIYMIGNLENVSEERLKNFFIKTDGHYQVIKAIRDVCVFAVHNLLTDPPFSKIDIVSCQNVLIYFETKAQKKILKAFHYALKPNGFLLLGKSETINNSPELFIQVDKELKVYNRKGNSNSFDFDFSFTRSNYSANELPPDKLNKENLRESDIEKETDKLLLSRYVPPSVVVNNDLQIMRFHGPTSRFLQPIFGKASLNLLKMVRQDIAFELRSLITKAKKEGTSAEKEVHLLNDDSSEIITLEVVPVASSSNYPYFLIIFKDSIQRIVTENAANPDAKRKIAEDKRIITLENELNDAREDLKKISEEFEATREELQSANEEVLSSNEELQSINEELETSKEELQSSNEELTTINDELNRRNNDLKEAFEYRQAIVETIREPLVVLNMDLRIKSANPAFYKNFLLNQNESEGFLISEIKNGEWNIPGLKEHISQMIAGKKGFEEFEVTHEFSEIGKRILQFNAIRMRFDDPKKDRVLLVIEDITKRRSAEENFKQSLNRNISILSSISDIFISVDSSWKIIFINEKAEKFIGKKTSELSGKNLWETMIHYMNTDFHKMLVSSMKTKTFSQFEYFDEHTQDWYHFRLYPSDETFSIYGNKVTEERKSAILLRESKERYETFISKTSEGVSRFDLKIPVSIHDPVDQQIRAIYNEAFVAECNDAMAKMYGLKKADELIGQKLEKQFVPGEKNDQLFNAFIALNYRLSEVETSYKKGENSTYFLHNLVGIIENEKLVSIWASQRDVTSQKLIEATLAKTRNQLNFALAAGSVGTYVWNFKTDKITWTKVQESLYGLKEYSFKGNLDDWLSFIHPVDKEPTRSAIEKSIKEKQELSAEFRIFWPDGSLHWILSRANTNFDKNGEPLEMSGVNIDISERKFKEQLILENEERFKALVQNSFDVITVFNLDGIITYQSESIERVLGYAAKQRVGENIFEKSVVHPEDREAEKKLVERCLEEPSKYIQGELRMLHKDGRYRIMEVGCINLVNNSSIHGIIKNYRDITKRREIEKQKEEFIGVASHELKTPVTSIKAYAQILQDTLIEKEDHVSADLLLRMDHQIDRLTTLISDLLDVTKITEGQLVLKREEYDLTELINEVVTDLQMTTKKHQIIKELQPVKRMNGDKERTAQVIVNLLSNAIKYSPSGNKIILKTTSTDDEVTISIQDFGIGISTEMQKKLFRRFFRVTDETTSTFPGLGLGLFIATEIVRKQHGRIWVESTPKEGSTFFFSLPYNFK